MPLDGRNGKPESKSDALRGWSAPHPYLPTLATVAAVIAALYFGRAVFLPIAVALLLTFALAPVVSALRRLGIPRLAAVVASVVAAFAALALFSFVVAVQVGELAQNVSIYQANILAKIRTLREAGTSAGIVERLSGVVEQVGREIERQDPTPPDAAAEPEPDPLPVEIVSPHEPIEVLQNLIAPLISPLATAGLVIVIVIFMLLEREALRDRFIRLAGYDDLHRTTEALQDAGRRVGQYLLMQLVVNVTYAVPVTIGLWLIGLPNALLWGLLALVLRFVPYIGPAIGMLLPLFVAVGVSPGWMLVVWTAALFVVMELVSNNFVEPWLYGSRTGLSPLAVIVSAVFWTWIWGPLGLVLSTPLTVCLVVLGRHVPHFEFLYVLFGNEPVLEPHAQLYQRLLAGDPDEATDHAEKALEEEYLFAYYDRVAIPALRLGEFDRARGVMSDVQRRELAASAMALVANLEDIADEEAEETEDGREEETAARQVTTDGQAEESPDDLPDGAGHSVLCAGGRGELDDAAAAMLAQVLRIQGASVAGASFEDLGPTRFRQLALAGVDTVVIGFLNADSLRHARIVVRRLKRAKASLRVGIVFWTAGDQQDAERFADELNADFVAFDVIRTVHGALSDRPAVALRKPGVRLAPPRRLGHASEPGTIPS